MVVQQKLEQMRRCWLELETTTRTRARQLFEHKAQLDVGGWRQLDQQLSHLEQQPPQLEHSQYLPPSSQQPHRARVSSSGGSGPPPRGDSGSGVYWSTYLWFLLEKVLLSPCCGAGGGTPRGRPLP